jgi:VanZ like family/Concanavalin A-like lectin/glucanases superfamily
MSRSYQILPKILGTVCLALLAGMLAACLWPFHSPKNEVAWVAHGNGLSFGRFGMIVGGSAIKPDCQPERGCTLEMWLSPRRVWDGGTILALYDPHHVRGFSLRQSNGSFLVVNGPWNKENIAKAQKLYAGHTFGRVGFTLLTLTFGPHGTSAYINGAQVRAAPQFRVPLDEFSGRLVVGNSPVLPESWSGEMKALALYDGELTSGEVFGNYEAWTRTGRPEVTKAVPAIALYLFDEHSGNRVHNRARSGGDLFIPKRYMELHHTLLRRPWDEYSPGWGYWRDVLINIAGFVPMGFFCYAYLLSISFGKRPALATILLGCLLSLTVEILQAYLPTRDSGMTDIFTNTLGATAGVGLLRCLMTSCSDSRFRMARYLAGFIADQRVCETKDETPSERAMCTL